MKTIAIVCTSSITVNKLIKHNLTSLLNRGLNVNIVCGLGEIDDEIKKLGINLIQIDMNRKIQLISMIKNMFKANKILKEIRPTALISSTIVASLIFLPVSKWRGVPSRIYHIRGAKWENSNIFLKKLMISVEKLIVFCSTKVLSVSKSLSELFINEGISSVKPIVLGKGGSKGVDLQIFRLFDDWRPNKDFRMGFLGRLSKDKGIAYLVSIIKILDVIEPDYSLEIIGFYDVSDPPKNSDYMFLLSHNRVSFHINLEIEDIVRRVQNWDIHIFPSLREGMPNAVLEMGACGVPTVAWNVTGVRDCIIDNINGRLIQGFDVNLFAKSIIEFKSKKNDRNFQQNLIQWYRTEFNSESVNRLFTDFIMTEVKSSL
jgi:glycosyltransferase involved in cell wall biosynthesis